jgi:multiple sugar transport system permease protein
VKKSIYTMILDVLTYLTLGIGALTMLLPFLWMVSVSFREPAQQYSRNIIPDPFTLQNYIGLFQDLPNHAFPYLVFNSFKLSALAVVGQILTCAMAAFVFAIVKFKGREVLFVLLLATMMIPSQVSLIPNFIIFKYLHLIGTQWPLILPAFWGGAFGTFLLLRAWMVLLSLTFSGASTCRYPNLLSLLFQFLSSRILGMICSIHSYIFPRICSKPR